MSNREFNQTFDEADRIGKKEILIVDKILEGEDGRISMK